jgi:hypothetical protein
MYIIPHLCVAKHAWSFEILNLQMYTFWISKFLNMHVLWSLLFKKIIEDPLKLHDRTTWANIL